MRFYWSCITTALLLASIAVSLRASELPRMLVIGDSISMNYTPIVRSLLAGRMEVVHIGSNGRHTRNGIEHLDDWLGDGQWDIIHFNWGLHDLRRRQGSNAVPIEEYGRNLDQLVQRMAATEAQLIWATTTPVPHGSRGRHNDRVIAYNNVAAQVMQAHGVVTNDLYSFVLPNQDQWMRKSNVHFHDVGYQALAERIVAMLMQETPAHNILVIGDSRSLPRRGWVEPLQEALGDTFVVHNASRHNTQLTGKGRFDSLEDRARHTLEANVRGTLRGDTTIDTVILALGSDDIISHSTDLIDTEDLQAWLAALAAFDWEQGTAPKMILLSQPDFGPRMAQAAQGDSSTRQAAALATALRSIAETNAIIDGYALMPASDEWFRHPRQFSDKGIERMVAIIANHLRGDGTPSINLLEPDDDDTITGAVTIRFSVNNFPLHGDGGGVRIHLNDVEQTVVHTDEPFVLPPLTPGSYSVRVTLVDAVGKDTDYSDSRRFIVSDNP